MKTLNFDQSPSDIVKAVLDSISTQEINPSRVCTVCGFESAAPNKEKCQKCGAKMKLVTAIKEGGAPAELPIIDKNSVEYTHEINRIDTMSERALQSRIFKCSPAKLYYFMEALSDKNMVELAAVAKERLESMGYHWDEKLNTYTTN